jgi:glycosyltransferase involved in cell wall biosynthesis
LRVKIAGVLNMSEAERQQFRQRAETRVRERYSWEAVTDEYEELLKRLVNR